MNPTGTKILADPQPCGHIVYPYTDETQLAEAVCLFASAGLRKGEAIILVMTAAHSGPIRRRLEQEGLHLNDVEATGQLVCHDAENLLSEFLFDGIIDEHKFKTTLGSIIEKAKGGDGATTNRPVRVFGEMVDLLWTTNLKATERLEQLWNEVIEAHSVPLLCAYTLAGSRPSALPESLLACHSHSIATA
jgi:hypothetical protein